MATPEHYGEFGLTEHNDLTAGMVMLARLPIVKSILHLADHITDGSGGDEVINYHCLTEPDARIIHVRRTAHDNPCSNINTTFHASSVCHESMGRLRVVRYRTQPGQPERPIGSYSSDSPHRNGLLSIHLLGELAHVRYLQRNRRAARVELGRKAPLL